MTPPPRCSLYVRMVKDWTDDDDLALTVAMELSRHKLPPKANRDEPPPQREARRKRIARDIVAAIRKANWTFRRGATARGFSTDWKGGE